MNQQEQTIRMPQPGQALAEADGRPDGSGQQIQAFARAYVFRHAIRALLDVAVARLATAVHPSARQERLVITNGSATRIGNQLASPTGRIALWVLQIVLAAMFIFAGGSKLLSAPAMVELFNAVGFGQWFRYVTGAIEISGAVMLLIPSAAVFGALLLIPTMIGAVATNLALGQSPAPPLFLLLCASAVAWARRGQLQRVLDR